MQHTEGVQQKDIQQGKGDVSSNESQAWLLLAVPPEARARGARSERASGRRRRFVHFHPAKCIIIPIIRIIIES